MRTSIVAITKVLAFFITLFCLTSSVSAKTDDSFARIQAKGILVIGMDDTFAPMGFKDKNGQIIGFDVDLAKAVAERLKLKVIFQPCVWDTIFLELKNGNIDAIWNGVTINAERKANALFSKPYMSNKIIILANSNSNFTQLADLNGKKIAAQAGAPAVDYVKNYKGADFNPATLKELVQYPDNPTALYDLKSGGVDAVVLDETYADYYMNLQKTKFKKISGFSVTEEDGVAFRKNDVALRDKVQAQLDAMICDGTAASISQKWFGRNIFKNLKRD